jgi:hypothetical protein
MSLIGYLDGDQLRLITKSDQSREKFTHIHTGYPPPPNTHTHTQCICEREEELVLVSNSV